MRSIGILDSNSGDFFRLACKKLGGLADVRRWNDSSGYDAVIVSADSEIENLHVRGNILIVPSGYTRKIEGRCVISYGMSERDTVTLSSLTEDNMVVALRRDIVGINGSVIPRQEFPFDWSMSAYNALPIASALILL